MTSVVSICNMALSCIGEARIDDLDEGSAASQQCSLHYEPSRDYILELHGWKFAQQLIAPSLSAEDPPTGWAYAYTYPSNCLRVQQVGQNAAALSDMDEEFDVQSNAAGTGKLIVTQQTTAIIRYTRKVTNPQLFSPAYIESLQWWLASKMAFKLTSEPGEMKRCLDMWRITHAQAMETNMREGYIKYPVREASWVEDRA